MSDRSYNLPPLGQNPSSTAAGTTPGCFANAPQIAPGVEGRYTFSSPDTPGMPEPSGKTAWDFLPEGWSTYVIIQDSQPLGLNESAGFVVFEQANGTQRYVSFSPGFVPSTQLEFARLGIITPEMKRVAERETHLTPAQVRDEVAAGRMVIPANKVHLGYQLDPMAIGRASKTKVNANMGASPVSSGTDEEVIKLKWAERWGADTVMDLSTGGNLDECRDAIIQNSTVPIGTVPIYSMIIGRKLYDLNLDIILESLRAQAAQGVDYFTIHAGVLQEHLQYVKDRLIGIVSRGGSLLAKWMIDHNEQNPMYTGWEAICDIMRQYDVTFSIG
ncbi:MAG: phosphomethylpyrimidine synthase ThiC, partial [Planctomycetaceae bacterium]|nr:phosphomethylpyrimidine synthase ThiC [Planctomycetaceae bacterium]